MPSIKIEVDHCLGSETAGERLSTLPEVLKKEFGDNITIDSVVNSFGQMEFNGRVYGFKIYGDCHWSEIDVIVVVTIPLAALPMRGTAEKKIREKLEELLS